MDRERLKYAAIDYSTYTDSDDYDVTMYNAFVDSADWLMQQPLSERLTDEEKEKIIKRYKDELEVAQHHTIKMKESTNPTSRQFHANVREGYISRLKLLEQIFGKNLFKEK